MYQSINAWQFIEAFKAMDREDNFTIEARRELFNYYGQLEEDTGKQLELDVIAICGEWCELEREEILASYPNLFDEDEDEEDIDITEIMSNETICIPLDNGAYLIQEF